MTHLSPLALDLLAKGQAFTLAVEVGDVVRAAAMAELVNAGLATEVGEHLGENDELGPAGHGVSKLYALTEAGGSAQAA